MEVMEVREEPEIRWLMKKFCFFHSTQSIWQSGRADKLGEVMKKKSHIWRFNTSDIFIYSLNHTYRMFKLQISLDNMKKLVALFAR